MPAADMSEVFDPITQAARDVGISEDLAVAIALTETNANPLLVRFEPAWKWFEDPVRFASANGISCDTERTLQAISWGPMQVMGAVVRELGFTEMLTRLTDAYLGALYGCHKLKTLLDKYPDQKDAIAAYNAGSPRHGPNGLYVNQGYVDTVLKKLETVANIT